MTSQSLNSWNKFSNSVTIKWWNFIFTVIQNAKLNSLLRYYRVFSIVAILKWFSRQNVFTFSCNLDIKLNVFCIFSFDIISLEQRNKKCSKNSFSVRLLHLSLITINSLLSAHLISLSERLAKHSKETNFRVDYRSSPKYSLWWAKRKQTFFISLKDVFTWNIKFHFLY